MEDKNVDDIKGHQICRQWFQKNYIKECELRFFRYFTDNKIQILPAQIFLNLKLLKTLWVHSLFKIFMKCFLAVIRFVWDVPRPTETKYWFLQFSEVTHDLYPPWGLGEKQKFQIEEGGSESLSNILLCKTAAKCN